MASIPCPRCRAPLEPQEVSFGGRVLTVYQCDVCTVPWKFDGEEFQTAFTFALDADGHYFDAETLDPLPRPSEPSENCLVSYCYCIEFS